MSDYHKQACSSISISISTYKMKPIGSSTFKRKRKEKHQSDDCETDLSQDEVTVLPQENENEPTPLHASWRETELIENVTVIPPTSNTTSHPSSAISALDSVFHQSASRFNNRKVEYVGFDFLPSQIHRKSIQKGFKFSLLVAGESGLGKSTLINTLFNANLYVNTPYGYTSTAIDETKSISSSTFELKEGSVKLDLTIIDTPGFGDCIDNTKCCDSVIKHIEDKFDEYMKSETRLNRTNGGDHRVHCCLYFIPPTGHGLRPVDIDFMKKLQCRVNLIPLIAKADTLTSEECASFKGRVLRDIENNEINIYTFPSLEEEGKIGKGKNKSDKEIELDSYRQRMPFAVIGGKTLIEVENKFKQGRHYPWGTAFVEDINHCDFVPLQELLIKTHMQDLISVTNDLHYENFRQEQLSSLTGKFIGSITCGTLNINPVDQIERERRAQEHKLEKMEKEMELVFEMKVKEKTRKLKQTEEEFFRKFDLTMQTLEESRWEVEERRKKLNHEREMFNSTYLAEVKKPENEKEKKKKSKIFSS